MSARLRILLLAFAAAVLALPVGMSAHAHDCNPPNPGGIGTDWCHRTPEPTEPPTPPPPAPDPTPPPPAPTPAPTAAPQRRTTTTTQRSSTPAPAVTVDDGPEPTIEVELDPIATPQIIIGETFNESGDDDISAQRAADTSAGGWAFFVAGLILGGAIGFVGRSALAFRRRRRHQIFG